MSVVKLQSVSIISASARTGTGSSVPRILAFAVQHDCTTWPAALVAVLTSTTHASVYLEADGG